VSTESGSVLIVDDERSIRLSLKTILGNFGFDIVEAARGEEAVALVRTEPYCLTSTCRGLEESKSAGLCVKSLHACRS